MPRKRTQGEAPAATTPPSETPPEATTSPTEPAQNGNGKGPAFKVGPIPTSKDNAVAAAVWANEVQVNGEAVTVYNITVESRYRDQSGEWKSGRQFRGSQVYALVYALNRCSDWILAQRDPQQACPF